MDLGVTLLEVIRSGMVESVHAGHLLIEDSDGNELLSLGDVTSPIYPRSAIKAIQASAMVRSGLRLSPKQLALVCASHAGSNEHLEVARSILIGAGLDESALQNTPDKPLGSAERIAWGEKVATSLSANCSGKHAGMLATCVANNWDLKSYREPSHPLQQKIIEEFERLSQVKIEKISIDGCGAPLFALSIKAISRAVRNLIRSQDPVHQEVISACIENPTMVSGNGRLPTLLMESGKLFAKDGAEGVMEIATRSGGTITWKMSDGSQRGANELAMASLAILDEKVDLPREKVLGGGQVVGEVVVSKLVRHG